MSGVEVTVSGGTAPTVNVTGSGPNAVVDGEIVVQIGGGDSAAVVVPAATGVTSLNALSGAVTLAVVGGSIAATGNTLTITVSAGVSSWNDLTDKPATFPPSPHGHAISDVTGLQTALDGKQAAGSYVVTTDGRLTDAREWSAATVTQAEAEAGTATTRVAWTVQRVWQAIAAWWAASSAKSKLDGIAAGATQNQTDAYLLSRANHTGTQTASTISDFTTAVVAAAPPTTNASLLTSGTLDAGRLPTSGVTAGTYTSVTVDTYGRVTAGSTPVTTYARRFAWASPYSYLGRAPSGSATSAAVWTIKRTQVSTAGAVVASLTATNVAWDNYATASYS